MTSPCELLSKRERELTPPRFAEYLVNLVRQRTGSRRVAVLYASFWGPYTRMKDVEVWPLWAERYNGPWPVIAHPPCGPWGKLAWRCKYQVKQCGIDAMNAVHRFGGIVEHPVGSSLFRLHGDERGQVEKVYQEDFGHFAPKKTLLYCVFPVRSPAGKIIDW